jgi:myo-inositol-1(or 4)-monophosphatase
MLDAFITSCIKANQEIYEYIHTRISSWDLNYSNTIGEGGDNSLNIDIIFEKIFIKHLLPFGNIYSEEVGFIEGEGNAKIIIDPLDGSSNFLAGLPYYGTSVAIEMDDEVKASCICNLANHTILYKIEDEELIELDLVSLVGTHYFSKNSDEMGIFEKAYSYPEITQKLFNQNIKFRSPGAVALSLAYAKNYTFVLFAGKIRPFDIKAALHMCSDLYVHLDNSFLIVSKNIGVFNKIKEIIKE